jgi:hypothetical protein
MNVFLHPVAKWENGLERRAVPGCAMHDLITPKRLQHQVPIDTLLGLHKTEHGITDAHIAIL